MKEFIIAILVVLLPFIIVCGSTFSDKMLDRSRRKKHPEYFEFFDAAMKISFGASNVVNRKVDYIKYQMNILTTGLREGTCEEDYFRKRFNELADMHVEVTNWFKEQQQEAEKLFKEADFYAKEHDLLWGVLY